MPKRPRSHALEDISRNRLHRIFEEIGWTVEDITKDHGEDFLVRIFDHGTATPLKFFVQAKATDNIARYLNRKNDAFRIRLDTQHLDQWDKFHEPVILAIWDSRSENIYWACVQDAWRKLPRDEDSRKHRTVSIPICRGSLLDAGGLRRLRAITQIRQKRLAREKEAVEVLKELLEAKLGVKVQHSPESGVVMIEKPDKSADVVFFGEAANRLIGLAEKLNRSPEEALAAAIERTCRDVDRYDESGEFPVMNPSTGKVEKRKMTDSELRRYVLSELERFDQEAEE